jgi:hypothetical protein
MERESIPLHDTHPYTNPCWTWNDAIRWCIIWQVPVLYTLLSHM